MATENTSTDQSDEYVLENNNHINNIIFSHEDLKECLSNKQRITKPFLTKYERARIIGYRAEQLASGTKPCVEVNGLTSVVDIATKELNERKIPLIIKRTLPNNVSEYWKIEELDII
jgi:DNA-directed RNA polymerase I, II, and III subunit RPABC2